MIYHYIFYISTHPTWLEDRSILLQLLTASEANDYHHQVVNAVSVIFGSSQDSLLMAELGPLVRYLVQLVACQDFEIASLACKFWADFGVTFATASLPASVDFSSSQF